MSFREKLDRGEPIAVAGLGDSLTYGWMVEQGFFDRFMDRAISRFSGSEVTRLNAGVPGDTAAGGLGRLGRVLSARPDLLTVQFGLNDLYGGVPVESFEHDLGDIVRRTVEAGAFPVLVTSCPLVEEREQRAATRYYDAIRETGRLLHVPVADLDRFWRDSQGLPSSWKGLIQGDGVHPTDAGHEIMALGLFLAFEHILADLGRSPNPWLGPQG